jgi:hypothetical protein
MSFLPYDRSGPSRWYTASAVSLALHGIVLALAWGGLQHMGALPTPLAKRPEVRVTLERLRSETLAGNILQDGMTGARPDAAPDLAEADLDRLSVDSEVADDVGPDTLEPSDTATEAEAAAAPEVTPEALQPVAPDLPAAQQPEALSPAPILNGTASPVAPHVAEALDPIIPLATAPVAAAALQGQALSPIVSGQGATEPNALSAVSPENPAIAALPVGRAEAVSAVMPTAPAIGAASAAGDLTRPAPGKQDLAVADLIRKIRATPADPCLLALPRRDGSDGIGLALISGADLAMTRFSDSALGPEDSDIRQTRTLVDPRQCPALNMLRQTRDYPATRLALRLDRPEVPSGETLTGDLAGIAGRYVLLLLVDNNGVVQDLQRFMTFSGNTAQIDVPVTRVGSPRDTAQLLIAIATTRPASQIRAEIGQLAQDVFANVDPQVIRDAAVAVTTFDVR